MLVKQAKEVARRWIMEEAVRFPDLRGAYLAGSILWMAEDALLPATSDVDVMLVMDEPPPLKLGKFVYQGVLLEVSYMPGDQLRSPEYVLGQSHLAGSFRNPHIILDPSGRLTELQLTVARDYAKRRWVHKRCEQVAEKALTWLQASNVDEPFHAQVTAWLFGTSLMTHMLLVAGLKNPTVRRRYMAVQELLAEYGRLDFHEDLLTMLGCGQMGWERAEEHLVAVAEAFDVTKTLLKTPYRFAADLSDMARPVAIEGSLELIRRGFHREALFWMVATYSRCMWVLQYDAGTETQERFDVGYRRLVADLGIETFADLQHRCRQSATFLPSVWQVVEAIIAANPDIE